MAYIYSENFHDTCYACDLSYTEMLQCLQLDSTNPLSGYIVLDTQEATVLTWGRDGTPPLATLTQLVVSPSGSFAYGVVTTENFYNPTPQHLRIYSMEYQVWSEVSISLSFFLNFHFFLYFIFLQFLYFVFELIVFAIYCNNIGYLSPWNEFFKFLSFFTL